MNDISLQIYQAKETPYQGQREREREREEKGTHVCKEVKGQEEGRSAAGSPNGVQPADIGWPTGNGKELNNSQACCLAQLCLAAA